MPHHEAEALPNPDSFHLHDYQLVVVDLLYDNELDDNEWISITGRSVCYRLVSVASKTPN